MPRVTAPEAHRQDAEVFAEARLALDNDPNVPATAHVHVNNGVVTITGTVRVMAQRRAAERIVRRINGVSRVVNLLNVAEMPSAEAFGDAGE
jgi:osmotically-inducible protein OsmY